MPLIRQLRILRTQKNSSDSGRLDTRVAKLLGKQSKIRVASPLAYGVPFGRRRTYERCNE